MTNNSKYIYDKKAADRVINWIEKYICHVKGELQGKKIILEDWQKDDIIRPLFGWKHRITKLRRYRKIYVEIPRKNAKSTIAAGIGLYLLLADNEPGAEIYSAAAERIQAGIVHEVAKYMVNHEKALNSRAECFRNSITCPKTGSFYHAISADARTKHGFNAHGIIFDELHTQPNRELYDVLTTSVGSRRQPLIILLTTAGFDKQSICFEMHDYAVKVRDGIIEDDTFLPVIYTVGKEMDIYSEETWKIANPGYGSIVKKAYIKEQINVVKNNPSFEDTFRRLHLNQWTSSETTWLSDIDYMKCDLGKIDLSKYKGRKCYAGLDLASIRDLSALVLIFPWLEGEGFDVVPFFWLPEETAKARSVSVDVNYNDWIRQGLIEATPGNVTDYNIIKKKIIELDEDLDIQMIGFDKWNASQLVIDLQEEGIETFDPVSMYMSVISAPTKELERLIMELLINHAGNPILRWMMSNIMLVRDTNDNIRPDKSKSKNKIDGIVALIIALCVYMTGDSEPDINEIYKNKGL